MARAIRSRSKGFRHVKATGLLAVLFLGACNVQGAAETIAPDGPQFHARVRALDGDTVAADFRLLGVDAFESRQLCEKAGACWACGKAAQDFAAKALKGGEASIRLTGTTTYGRPVAIVTAGGKDLGEEMIRAGFAIPQPQFLRRDPDREDRYQSAHVEALNAQAGGLAGTWLSPSDWRRGKRLACER